MHTKSSHLSALLIVTIFCGACSARTGGAATTIGSGNGQGATQSSATGELKYKAPESWVAEKPSSTMPRWCSISLDPDKVVR
jgi:hypothetical protein